MSVRNNHFGIRDSGSGIGLESDQSRVTSHQSPLFAWWSVALVIAMLPLHALADPLVDPTRPPMVRNKVVATHNEEFVPRVTAIFQSGERRVAVFDGQVVKTGDRVGELVIEAITVDGVKYRRGGQVLFARLPKQAAVVRRKVDSEESEP